MKRLLQPPLHWSEVRSYLELAAGAALEAQAGD